MAKIKLTKGELKRQRDALYQYKRYLPTLQLKKQQLQMEILRQYSLLEEKRQIALAARNKALGWVGLLTDKEVELKPWLKPVHISVAWKNIAGVDLSVFERAEFADAQYDLFIAPLWMDSALEELRELASLREEIKLLEEGIVALRQELRVTTQRVNLFEKIKIPEASEAIRIIKIYLGDQMTNAVGRSKIAKRKISEVTAYETAASLAAA